MIIERTCRWGLLAIALVAAGCDCAQETAGATRPVRSTSRPAGDWVGYQGGGAMLGVAGALPAPPLRRLWKYDAGGAVKGGAAIVGKVVYFGDSKGTLHAVNLADGKRRWTYKADGGIVTTPLVHEGRVLVGDEEGTFHCVATANGLKLWTFKTDDGPIHSSANAAGNRVLFGSDDNFLYCLNVKSGEEIWKLETDNFVYCSPVIEGGRAFIAGCDGYLRVVDLANGKVVRSVELKYAAAAAPLVLADVIVAVTMGGHVQCFDRKTLAEIWTKHLADAEFFGSPALSKGVVVVGSRGDRRVYGLDLAKGKKKWDFLTRGSVDCPPTISGKLVYVGGSDGKLYALRLATGGRVWQYVAGRSVSGGVAVARGVLVIGDNGGTVHCLGRRR